MPRMKLSILAITMGMIGAMLAAAAISPARAVGETSGSAFVPVAPFRAAELTMTGGTTTTIQIRGQNGIPSTGVSAVVVDLAATSSTATSSYLTAWPTGQPRPGWGTVYFNKDNAPRSNTTIVKLGSGTGNGGKIDIYNNSGTSKVYVDVQGYFTATSDATSPGGFVPVDPTRVLNTAIGFGTATTGKVPSGGNRDVQVTDGQIIPDDATAVFANIEARDANGPGIVQAGPGFAGIGGYPATMNYGSDGVYSTGTTIKLNSAGQVRLRNGQTNVAVNLKLDIQGYFTGDPTKGGSFTPINQTPRYSTSWDSETSLEGGETRTVEIAGGGGLPLNNVGAVSLIVTVRQWTANGALTLWNAEHDIPPTTNVGFTANKGAPSNGVSTSAIVSLSEDGQINLRNSSPNPIHVTLATNGYFTSGPPCQFSIEEAGSEDLSVTDGVDTEVLSPTDSEDPTLRTYTGEIGDSEVDVTVWMGASESAVMDELDQAEAEQPALSETSVDEASDTEGTEVPDEAEVEVAFDNPSTALPQDYLEPVGYKLESSTTLEYGGVTSSACEKVDPDSAGEVLLGSRTGIMSVPNDRAGTAARASAAASSAVRYRTFIPGAKGNGLHCGYFKGDNRGFTSYYRAPNSRSRASVFFNWSNRTITTSKYVGATHRYAGNGLSAKTKTASSKGIKFHHGILWSTYGKMSVNHAMGNPLCGSAGPIRYNVVIEAWRSGAARISGKRGKVPNHEAYLYPRREAYGKKIFRRSSSKFICLSLNCGDESLWETT